MTALKAVPYMKPPVSLPSDDHPIVVSTLAIADKDPQDLGRSAALIRPAAPTFTTSAASSGPRPAPRSRVQGVSGKPVDCLGPTSDPAPAAKSAPKVEAVSEPRQQPSSKRP